jgi:hypothetical protein
MAYRSLEKDSEKNIIERKGNQKICRSLLTKFRELPKGQSPLEMKPSYHIKCKREGFMRSKSIFMDATVNGKEIDKCSPIIVRGQKHMHLWKYTHLENLAGLMEVVLRQSHRIIEIMVHSFLDFMQEIPVPEVPCGNNVIKYSTDFQGSLELIGIENYRLDNINNIPCLYPFKQRNLEKFPCSSLHI